MVNDLRKRIENTLDLLFAAKNDNHWNIPGARLIFDTLQEFTKREGKRIRPLMLLAGFRGISQREPEGLLETACSLELLHSFILIHDDIVDKAEFRRGKPSVHRILGQMDNATIPCRGLDTAMIAGDILYSMAIRVFLTVAVDRELKENALLLLARAGEYTGIGQCAEAFLAEQAIDDVTEEDVLSVYDHKTGYYSFAVPLAIGLMLAEGQNKWIDLAMENGLKIGRAFQMVDDLFDISGKGEILGKPTGSDICKNLKTLPLLYLYRSASENDKSLISEIMRNQKQSPEVSASTIRNLLKKYDIEEKVNNTACKLTREALDKLSSSISLFRSPSLLNEILLETVLKRETRLPG